MQLLAQISAMLPGRRLHQQLLTSYLDLVGYHWQPRNQFTRNSTHKSTMWFDDDALINELLQGFGLIDGQSNNSALEKILGERIPVHPSSELTWDTIKLIQSELRAKIAGRRVCVEANPTSNLLIGGYKSYADMPYKDWVEAGLSVSINTDDPGLFMTTLPQEFSSLYSSHFDPDTSHQKKTRWLNDRRLDALEHSFFTPDSLNRLKRDDMIMTYLRNFHSSARSE